MYDVLEYLASRMSEAEILNDFPDLTREDIRACLAFAADRERKLVTIARAWGCLFDQNLSPRLLTILADLYRGSTDVRNEGLETAERRHGLMRRVAPRSPAHRL